MSDPTVVLEVIAIATASLLPALLGRYWLRRSAARLDARLQRARQMRPVAIRMAAAAHPRPILGDPRCRYSANSPHLRCAVNPQGPCEHCTYFRARSAASAWPVS